MSSSTTNLPRASVIGIGKLGLCFALVLEQAGYDVVGVDVSPQYVDNLNRRTFHSLEPHVVDMLKTSSGFRASINIDDAISHSSLIFIFVATPNSGHAEQPYDHIHLSQVLSDINKRKVQDAQVVIGCTVMPGYIREVGRFLLRDCSGTVLSYNPEFIAQGSIVYGLKNADMVLIGEGDKASGDNLESIYRVVSPNANIERMSPESAEICKIGCNGFITSKIAYANLLGDIASITPGADPHAVLAAIGKDSRVGSKYFSWGFGYGGPCFPRDNRALAVYTKRIGLEPTIFLSTDKANDEHGDTQLNIVLEQLARLPLEQKKVEFSRVTYKYPCAVPLIEESAKLKLAEKLARQGVPVTIADNQSVLNQVQLAYGSLFSYKLLVE